jgi:hypothetical protein
MCGTYSSDRPESWNKVCTLTIEDFVRGIGDAETKVFTVPIQCPSCYTKHYIEIRFEPTNEHGRVT